MEQQNSFMENETTKKQPKALTHELMSKIFRRLCKPSDDKIVFKQFRFPRSKKKRIRKKWERRYCNYRFTIERSIGK